MRCILGVFLTALCFPAHSQVVTSQNDNARTSANLHETTLTPANVNARQFGRIFTLKVDGDIYAQPLYLPNVDIPGKGRHNVLFVATEHDSVYAFDADGSPTEPLWHVNFLDPRAGTGTVPAQDVRCPFIVPEIGITPTPVIDLPTGTLYVLARTKAGQGVLKRDQYEQTAACAGDHDWGREVRRSGAIEAPGFDPLRELPRAGLLLVNGQVYLTWASSCDVGTYHGWVMAYDAHTLSQTAVFNTSPGAEESGIWQSDNGPAADEEGNVYVATGNGQIRRRPRLWRHRPEAGAGGPPAGGARFVHAGRPEGPERARSGHRLGRADAGAGRPAAGGGQGRQAVRAGAQANWARLRRGG